MKYFAAVLLVGALLGSQRVCDAATAVCTRPVDLVMILDESGSVSSGEWSEATTFMQQIVGRYNVGQGSTQTRVAIIPFSKYVKTTYKFSSASSTSALQRWIGSMRRTYRSMTCTGKAMSHTSRNVIPSSTVGGYRNGANGASTVVIFLTDGAPSSTRYCSGSSGTARTSWLTALKSRADRVVPVGIGTNIGTSYLMSLSSGMPANKPYITASYNNLAAVLDDLAQAACPTLAPTRFPTAFPTAFPTTKFPTPFPTNYPSQFPTSFPSKFPTQRPTTPNPTMQPTSVGGCTATELAQCDATYGVCSCADNVCSAKRCTCSGAMACNNAACSVCTAAPTRAPTKFPTAIPSAAPTTYPTAYPTAIPTKFPTAIPSGAPTTYPTAYPTAIPSKFPTAIPTGAPTRSPTKEPTRSPTHAGGCTAAQNLQCDQTNGVCSGAGFCTCKSGFMCNGGGASGCNICTVAPTRAPTKKPTSSPSSSPTRAPTKFPTAIPTTAPTTNPTANPTKYPTTSPTAQPSKAPTKIPTSEPTEAPTAQPSAQPTFAFGCNPTERLDCAAEADGGYCFCGDAACTIKECGCGSGKECAAVGSKPCGACVNRPTLAPTKLPTDSPTLAPTMLPTDAPTLNPTAEPSAGPTISPTSAPSTSPTTVPTYWEFLNAGDSAQEDFAGLSSQEKAAVGASIGSLLVILIIVAVVAAAVVVLVALATGTGLFIRHKKMQKLDDHTFEGELVQIASVPLGMEVEAPSWANTNELVQQEQKEAYEARGFASDSFASAVNPMSPEQ